MSLIKNLIPEYQYPTKCPYSMTPIGVCIHNSANDASAKNERDNLARVSNQSETSFHVAVDDIEAIQCIPFNRNAWHSGDGGNGKGNRNYIAVEICYSLSGGERFINAENRAAKEVAALLKQYGWGINRVKKHQDFSGKYCPHRTLDMGWRRFLNMVQAELNEATVTITETKQATIQSEASTSGEYKTKEYPETGVFTCTVDAINFRNNHLISTSNPIQGQYYYGETVNYDYVVITNKYVYISWISSSTGVRRYMPVRDLINKEVWGTFV